MIVSQLSAIRATWMSTDISGVNVEICETISIDVIIRAIVTISQLSRIDINPRTNYGTNILI